MVHIYRKVYKSQVYSSMSYQKWMHLSNEKASFLSLLSWSVPVTTCYWKVTILISNSIECTKSMPVLWLTPFVLKYTCVIYIFLSDYSLFTYCYVIFHCISQFIHSPMDGHLGFQFFVIY